MAPKKFFGLHAHTGASAYDGLGPASDHFKWCRENGLDGHAITEHGHMNSFSSALLFNDQFSKDNQKFKYIPGVEAYIHPDLNQWRKDKELSDSAAAGVKAAKIKMKESGEKNVMNIHRVTDANDETISIETSNSLTLENEEETKSGKTFNPLNRRHHLVILPKTSEALQKIFHLVSRGYLEGFYRFPRIDIKMLKEAAVDKDIIISSACCGGIFSFEVLENLRSVKFDELNPDLLNDPSLMNKVINSISNSYDQYSDAVGIENMYIELQFHKLPAQHVINRALIEFAKRNSLTDKLIVTADSHYARPDLWYHREMYKKLGYLNFKDYGPETLPKSKDDLKAELYPKNAEQVWEEYNLLKNKYTFYDSEHDDIVSDAIERSHDVAHQVIGNITFDRSFKFPKAVIEENKTPFSMLLESAKEGLVRRGLADKQEYIDRLKHELEVIKKMDFASYFVTLSTIMKLVRDVCLVGVARGSAGGSLVAYCLDITDLDPIRYNCRFDRFLNVHRQGAPDIDIDVGDRDLVLDVLRKKFGQNNVLPISNYNTFKLKTLIKDISKFYGIPYDEVNEATKTVENDVRKAIQKTGDDKNLFVLKFEDAMKHSKPFSNFIEKYPQVVQSIDVLFKEQKALGRHAGGVVILDDAPRMMPLITSGGEVQTPWVEGMDSKNLEPLGFIKYDLLGLETMRLIQRTIELILKRKEGNPNPTFADVRVWYESHLHPDTNQFDDHHVYENVYHEGRFPGIFQLTSAGAQRLFKAAKPESIIDLAALTSIYRPGPLAAHVDKLYLKARAGEKFEWGHPLFEEVLGKTDNLLIFQEQTMDLAEHIGGFPREQCDSIRKTIMKRTVSGNAEQMKKARDMEEGFVAGAAKKGVPESIARDAYKKILYFSGYAFNIAHAVAYAIDSYMCAWLLTYYEEEWLCAYLESMSNDPKDKARAFGEIKGLGYEIVPIDINYASTSWSILPGKKFMPSFLSCKGIGEAAVEEIMAARPYKSIEDILWNEDETWRHSKFNKRALESLMKIGALESLGAVGKDLSFVSYRHMHEVIIENWDAIRKVPKKDPLQGKKTFYQLIEALNDIPDWTKEEKILNNIDVYGTLDVASLISTATLQKFDDKDIVSIDHLEAGDKRLAWFYVTSQVAKKTKNGKNYLALEVVGLVGKQTRVFMWGWNCESWFEPYTLCVAEVEKNDFGCSTNSWKLKTLD